MRGEKCLPKSEQILGNKKILWEQRKIDSTIMSYQFSNMAVNEGKCPNKC